MCHSNSWIHDCGGKGDSLQIVSKTNRKERLNDGQRIDGWMNEWIIIGAIFDTSYRPTFLARMLVSAGSREYDI